MFISSYSLEISKFLSYNKLFSRYDSYKIAAVGIALEIKGAIIGVTGE